MCCPIEHVVRCGMSFANSCIRRQRSFESIALLDVANIGPAGVTAALNQLLDARGNDASISDCRYRGFGFAHAFVEEGSRAAYEASLVKCRMAATVKQLRFRPHWQETFIPSCREGADLALTAFIAAAHSTILLRTAAGSASVSPLSLECVIVSRDKRLVSSLQLLYGTRAQPGGGCFVRSVEGRHDEKERIFPERTAGGMPKSRAVEKDMDDNETIMHMLLQNVTDGP